MGTWLPETCRK